MAFIIKPLVTEKMTKITDKSSVEKTYKVKGEELKAYGDALVARIEELEQSIHTQAGTEFNINSPYA